MRGAIVLDKHIAPAVAAEVFTGYVLLASATRKPKKRYEGPFQDDEDYHHVLQLTWENDALALTSDGALIEKAWNFGPCGSHGHRLKGILIVPRPGNEQRALLKSLIDGQLKISGIPENELPIEFIRDCNLGIDLRRKQPAYVELGDCPWDEDEDRRWRRFKRK